VPLQSSIWLDGSEVDALPLPDRGLYFGDGLFETLLLKDGRPLFLEFHLNRLSAGLSALKFPECLPQLEAALAPVLQAAQAYPWMALRLTVTRGDGPRGYAPPAEAKPRVIANATPLSADPAIMLPAATVKTAAIRWSAQPVLAGLKHLNRLEQVLAAAEAREAGVDEVLMQDQAGSAISVSAGNLFAVVDGGIATPLLNSCGIAGTRRRLILEHWAPQLGLDVMERPLTKSLLDSASELFFTNSLVGVRSIGQLNARQWQSFPVATALFQLYLKDLSE
jgi:4-amino-4-deoxychorismate lyase